MRFELPSAIVGGLKNPGQHIKKNGTVIYMSNVETYNKQLCKEYESSGTIELLERYVVSEILPPIADFPNAIKLIRTNYPCQISSKLLIIGAELLSGWDCGDNEMLEMLNSMYPYLSTQEKAIVCYLNANHLSFQDKNYERNPAYQKHLLKSLEYNVSFVKNRIRLADFYAKTAHTQSTAKKLYQEAVKNIVTVFTLEEIQQRPVEQFVAPDSYINEFILGTCMAYISFEELVAKT